MHVCVYIFSCECVYIFMCVCVYIHVCVYICMCVCVVQLRDILATFWMVISNHCRRCDVLKKSEYIEFKLMLQCAMLGYEAVDQEEATLVARQAYKHDVAHYTRIDEIAFKDQLAEAIGESSVV
jgi:hypothetical protein